MKTLRNPDKHLPEYVFTVSFEHHYAFKVEMVLEMEVFFSCLTNFLKQMGESSFWVKHNGELRMNASNWIIPQREIYIPVFEKNIQVDVPIKTMKERIILFDLGAPDTPEYYLQIGWDGVIEGETHNWAIHFTRPLDIAIVGIRREYAAYFEEAFFSVKEMRQFYIENLRVAQTWGMDDEAEFLTFVRNYFPDQIDKYHFKQN